MNEMQEFRVEYYLRLPVPRAGNFNMLGNPYDREAILTQIASHATPQSGEPFSWSQLLGLSYKVSETSRLLEASWDSFHQGNATGAEMVELLERSKNLQESPKIEKWREMHRQGDG